MDDDFARLLKDKPTLVKPAPLGFALLALSRTLHGLTAELLLQLGLYPGQELILMRLFDRDEQSQTSLQQSIGLDHSTVSRSIRRMEDAGLLARRPDPRDKRAMVVSLTEAGRALRPQIAQVWKTLESHLEDALGQDRRLELAPVVENLERSIAAVRAQRS
jgi:DNA-binding MarR family transcriptional regulator